MKRLIVLVIAYMFIAGMVFAADNAAHDVILNVVDVCLIDLNNTSDVTLSTSAPAQGGLDPVGATDATKLLQYTSLVPSGDHRNITVQWGALDAAPAGTSLRVEATSVPANCGSAAPQVNISDSAAYLITNIGSCATGIGANGAALLYTFSVDDVTQLQVGDTSTVTVTFTLTDAS